MNIKSCRPGATNNTSTMMYKKFPTKIVNSGFVDKRVWSTQVATVCNDKEAEDDHEHDKEERGKCARTQKAFHVYANVTM